MMSMVSNEANMGGDTALQLESQRMQRVHIYVGPTITRLHTALPRRLIRLAYSAVTLPLTCYLALSETGMRTRCRRTGAATKAIKAAARFDWRGPACAAVRNLPIPARPQRRPYHAARLAWCRAYASVKMSSGSRRPRPPT